MAQFNQLNLSVDYTDDDDTNYDANNDINKENKNISYFEWLHTVETLVFNKIGLYLEDLPDETFRINFDDGMSTLEMAKIIIDPYDNLISDSVNRILFDNN